MKTAIYLGLYCIASAINGVPVFTNEYSTDSFILSMFMAIFIVSDIYKPIIGIIKKLIDS